MTYQIDIEPIGLRWSGTDDVSLLDTCRQAGVGISSLCGGSGTCGSCKVQILDGQVSPLTGAEREQLSPTELADGYRLACQVYPQGNIRVRIPPESLTSAQRIQVEGKELGVAIKPVVEDYDIKLSPPTLEDVRSDVTRLQDYLLEQYGLDDLSIDLGLLRHLPGWLRELNWKATLGIRGSEIVSLQPVGQARLGLAVDLGTTKVAAYLVDLRTGQTIAATGTMNPQITYGEDVIARIAYAMRGPKETTTLSQLASTAITELTQKLCTQSKHTTDEIAEVVIVGNTAMHHLLLELPVSQLGTSPYVPALSNSLDVKARELGFDFAPGCYVHLLPNIAGFVGADHVAMLLATGIYEARETVIGIDIGTNTEITLRTPEKLISCSTASGPAFEGAHIKDGMRATDGAIERVRIIGSQVQYQTINNLPPVGLCGSGILDTVAQLVQSSIIGKKGVIGEHPRGRHTEHGWEFVLVTAEESSRDRGISVTRHDIEEIQLAKAAIRTGINVLLAEVGLTANDIYKVIIAGAFGTYLDVTSAITIGMFPQLPLECFSQVGNAAGMGAKLALISKEQRARAEEIARQVQYIELAANPHFAEEFTHAMLL